MAMTNRSFKKRIHQATFWKHNGNQDEFGNPTYTVDADWIQQPIKWPCEVLGASGGEVMRGRQVTATTTHVLYGEWFGVVTVTSDMRCQIEDGTRFEIVALLEPDGLSTEGRLDCRREQ